MRKEIGVMAVLLLVSIVSVSSIFTVFSVSTVPVKAEQADPWDFPRLDTLYMVEAYYWDTALTMAKECKIDVYLGAIQTYAFDTLSGLGWNITHSGGGLHYCYLGFNCRDYAPAAPGPYPYNYHNRNPGFALFPLNVSSFRHALPYIVGCEKTSWLWSLYKYISIRNDFPMPTGFVPWRNPYITEYPENWTYAEDILLENGFTVAKGNPNDRTTWIWCCPLRPGDTAAMKLIGGKNSASPGSDRPSGDGFGIYVMNPAPNPSVLTLVSYHVAKWNQFFTGENTDAKPGFGDPDYAYCLFHHEVMVTTGDVISTVFDDRCHDIFYLCGGFSSRNPDYLFDTFHSSQDVYDGNDDSGIINPGLDNLLYSTKYYQMKDYEILAYNTGNVSDVLVSASTDFTVAQPADITDIEVERCDKTGVYYEILEPGVNYTLTSNDLQLLKDITLYAGDALEINYNPDTHSRLITDTNFYRDIVWLADWKIFYLDPQIGVYSRDYFDLFKLGHEGWVDAPGYGAGSYELPWTFGCIHETGRPTGGSMKWQNDGDVVSLNPVNAKWVYEFEILNRIYEGLITRDPNNAQEMPWMALKWTETPWTAPGGVPGQIVRFYLRNDVTWQDGNKVAAADIKWNFDYTAHKCPDTGAPMPKYVAIWQCYINTTIVDDYTVDIYINATGHWKTLDYANVALQFPKIIWEKLQNHTGITNFKPWAVKYKDWTGITPPLGNDLTCLVGTGPFFLNYTAGGWNEAGLAVLSKYPGYWLRTAGMPEGLVGGLVPSDDPMLTVVFLNPTPDTLTFDYMITNTTTPYFPLANGTESVPPFSAVTVQHNVTASSGYVLWYRFPGGPWILRYTEGSPRVQVDLDGDFDVDEDDLWYFCGAFINYYKIHVLDPKCDFDNDGRIDEDDLWAFCASFIDYYWKAH